MKILKPPWVTHNGCPIFSIDVHPDGSRFVTAGQGESSGRITIWSVLPLLSADNEKNSSLTKMLCQMDNHFACVNCVRWSHNGTWLASAGDDKLVMIWRYAGGSSKVFGVDNVETWRCIHTLRGHSGDVLDLAWSPEDKFLATCSVDNTVVIWNSLKFPEQVKVLKGHTSMVKGVTWDPIGKYLASQSDDKTLAVWRTSDWSREKTVVEPFNEASGTTHVLRLGWSPDGTYLVSAHAMNNMGPTAQIISRDGWDTGVDFVGHRKAVTCVKFNPKLLKRRVMKKRREEFVKYCCCAVGSRDSSCSIWLTSLRRPLVVLHDLFNNSVIDLAWNCKGTQLFMCSSDGTVAFVEFTKEEIGTALTDEEQDKVLCSRYGKSTMANGTASTQIIENAELLKLHQHNSSAISNGGTTNTSTNLPTPKKPLVNGYCTPEKDSGKASESNMSANTPSKQIETRTKDGRRRITPIFLSPPPALGNIAPPVFTSTNEISKIVIEHASSEDASLFAKPLASESTSPKDLGRGKMAAADAISDSMAIIQPMSSAEAMATSTTTATKSKSHSVDVQAKPKTKPVQASSSKASQETVSKIAVKRKAPPPQAHKKRKDAVPTSDIDNQAAPPVDATPSSSSAQPPFHPKYKLSVPEVKKTLSFQISDEGDVMSLTATNNIAGGKHSLSSLQCVYKGVSWSAALNNSIVSVQASRHLVCVGCKEKSLSVFTADGQRLLPDITLDSDISYLSVYRDHCMAVTSSCFLYLWNFELMQCVVNAVDLSHLVTKGHNSVSTLSVSQCFLTQSLSPCLVLSDSSSYIYHTRLQSWLSFKRADDTVEQYSNKETINKAHSLNSGIVSTISSKLKSTPVNLNGLYKAEVAVHDLCTLSHIQNQMALCRAMGSTAEYRTWLIAYVKYLTHHEKETLLRELCSQCTQTVYKSVRRVNETHSDAVSKASKHNGSTPLMDLDKVKLLRDILPIIGSNLSLQRLYTEFRDLLDIMQSGLG
ncbi:protein HIRA-like [Watersipora subatra]|uniref:protein HIRA-like n=1 Tax=Watersipora subatra TaxID=2589382 RepID=UPI00355B5CC3